MAWKPNPDHALLLPRAVGRLLEPTNSLLAEGAGRESCLQVPVQFLGFCYENWEALRCDIASDLQGTVPANPQLGGQYLVCVSGRELFFPEKRLWKCLPGLCSSLELPRKEHHSVSCHSGGWSSWHCALVTHEWPCHIL